MKIVKEKFAISGMSCAACERAVDKAVRTLPFVKDVSVTLLMNTMIVEYDLDAGDRSVIEKAVKNAGYDASILYDNNKLNKKHSKENKHSFDDNTNQMIKRLILSIILLIPLMYLSMGVNMFNVPIPSTLSNNPFYIAIIQMLLATIIIYINKIFFISGFKALKHGSANMDTLVALGSSASFLYSVYITFFKFNLHELYFETAAMIPTLITIGKTLESISKGKTTNAIKNLLDMSPKEAHKVIDNKEIVLPVNELNIGDIVNVYAGESIPIDCVIIEGSAYVDESMLTGEPLYATKKISDTVYQGSINKNGFIVCRVIKKLEESTLTKVIQMVENVNQTKAPIAKIADEIAKVFVPIVMTIAFLTFVIWIIYLNINQNNIFTDTSAFTFALERAISVLVIACPCALGLATPTAIMVGSGIAAKNGILFKNAKSIEVTGKVDIAAFDKTGTLTNAKMQITDVYQYDKIDKEKIISLTSAIESKSNHPISNAFKKIKFTEQIDNFEEIMGEGLSCDVEKNKLLVGNEKLLLSNNIEKTKTLSNDLNKLTNEGKIVIIICLNKKIIGLIALSDTIKQNAKETIEQIKNLNIDTVMITGDNEKAANYIANVIGINEVISNVLPIEKAKEIEKLKYRTVNGKRSVVLMVGDGINDAVSLSAADVGLAIGKAKDIAIESSDIVLTNSNIMSVYNAIYLSKKVLKNIKENLFFAFFYNSICIPIAAGAFIFIGIKINPMIGALAMACSSVSVVLNALRLNLIKFDNIESEEMLMKKTFKVEGMMCEHCVMHVKKALEKIDGVTNVDVNLTNKNATIEISKEIDDSVFIDAIKDAGYNIIV